MIKHPSSTKTQVICDICRVMVEFAAGMTDDEANREIQRHGWETEPEHKCPLCYQGKWGTH